MLSELHSLLEKIDRLAELASTLRAENIALRLRCAALADDNADATRRMDQAHERVSRLLEQLPGGVADVADAGAIDEETA